MFIRKQLSQFSVEEKLSHQIVLAVDEACANSIIHHHKEDGKSKFDIFISRDKDKLTIEIKDKGDPFPINEYKPKDLEALLHDGTPGGLGILLITSIMDKVEVIRKDKHFLYRFVKNL